MKIGYRNGERLHQVEVAAEGDGIFRVTVDGVVLGLRVERRGDAIDLVSPEGVVRAWVTRDGERRFVTAPGVGDVVLERLPPSRRARREGAEASLASPMPGRVVKVHVRPGDAVRKGDTLLVVEAMKTELGITAPRDARVARVHVQAGDPCEAGRPLVELEEVP